VLSEICGDSLCGVDIRDGDLALIYLTSDIKPGDLVAALTPEGFLVKFLSSHDGKIRLQSANPDYPPRDYDPEDVMIQGKVIRTERP
jgi:DNA polymerase V